MQVYAFTRFSVDSSSIAEVGYDPAAMVMEVIFRRGTAYRYLQVPNFVVTAFLAASSKGAFFNTYVRSCFPYQRAASFSSTSRR